MRILYLLPTAELGGGTRVVFQHADLLAGLGHDVTVAAHGRRPDWAGGAAAFVDLDHVDPEAPFDLVVTTFWTTVEEARRRQLGPTVHFCQGFEGEFPHLEHAWSEIDAVYRDDRSPLFTVTPSLAARLTARYDRPARVVSPPVDPTFRPRLRLRRSRPATVIVSGIFEAEVKGIRTALEAVRRLRANGVALRLVRISVLPLGDEELSLLEPDEQLVAVSPTAVAERVRRADLLLFPSGPAEGFGLPLLEAMASGVPAVASRIPSTIHITRSRLPLVDPGDTHAFAVAARRRLHGPVRWFWTRRAALREAQRFAPEVIRADLAAAVDWVRRFNDDR